MRLTFLGKDSQPNQSPTLYATDNDSYIVQGWTVADPAVLERLDLGDDEAVVEVSPGLLAHLSKDGVEGEVQHFMPPIVGVLDSGNYIIQGKRVSDGDTLGQMDIPDYETCVEVAKSAVVVLIGG